MGESSTLALGEGETLLGFFYFFYLLSCPFKETLLTWKNRIPGGRGYDLGWLVALTSSGRGWCLVTPEEQQALESKEPNV